VVEVGAGIVVEEAGGMLAGGVIAVDEAGGVIMVDEAGGVIGSVGVVVVAAPAAPGSALSVSVWLQAASANEEASSRLQHNRRIFMAVSFG